MPLPARRYHETDTIANMISAQEWPHPSFGQGASILIDLALAQLKSGDIKKFKAYFRKHAKEHAE